MGVENGEMSLMQITVSSVLNDDEYYYGKQNIRLDAKPEFYTAAGAWVAQPKPEQFVRVRIRCLASFLAIVFDEKAVILTSTKS